MSTTIQPTQGTEVASDSIQTVAIVVQLAESISATFFNSSGVTTMSVIALGMAALEKYSVGKNLSTADKMKFATEAVPGIIDLLVRLGKIDAAKGATLKQSIQLMGDLASDFMNVTSFLTNNPWYIQSDQTNPGQKTKCFCF